MVTKTMRNLIFSFLFVISSSAYVDSVYAGSADECGLEGKACFEYGATVFQNRCSLCHGSDGLGEGVLSLSIKNYPNTNLLEPKHGLSPADVEKVIRYGGGTSTDKTKKNPVSNEMPPWGDELTMAQLESVTNFVIHLRSDTEKAMTLLRKVSATLEPSLRIGRAIFMGRCSLCHGALGLGDGKMSRIIKNPPPFNLTLSRSPDEYLSDIIHKGGGEMNRSPRMPPFGDDLSESDIASVIMFIKTLRQ